MKWLSIILSSFILLGCASSGSREAANTRWLYPPMARPVQPDLGKEVKIAQLTELLGRDNLPDKVKAKMFFERGNLYDAVGLKNLSRLDLERSLDLNPAQSEVFNMLGVYFTEMGQFDSAYEAFDSSLELDKNNVYAKRNQAIALYYGERPKLAIEPLEKIHPEDVEAPFHALWLYIIENDLDPVKAKSDLAKAYEQHKSDVWGWSLVAMMLNKVDEGDVFKALLNGTKDNTVLAQRLTEAYFYLAKRYQLEHQYADAIALYKLALSFNVYEYIENRYALLELEKIYHQLKEQQTEKDAS
ncbi:lipoprotein NlpI [Vibrio viridaestus]|uniref:lipoprotein NlpI n=1 Tax=Vibrio viridaestus TaxID=2487322 RepID=UPI0026C50080